jgi:hypothetical protein
MTITAVFHDKPLEKPTADALMQLRGLFDFRGHSMVCRVCGRGLPITQDGHQIQHVADCPNFGEQHPWGRLRALLVGYLPEEPVL